MPKPTTVRIPDDLLDEINKFVEELKLDRSAYLREVIKKGFSADKQDRILIPPMLRQYAEFDKDVVLVGVLDHFEIWARENWERENINLEEDMKKEDVRNEIAKLGL